MSDYDVIIVGARCAGSATAIALGQSGHRVLLVDRDAFPSGTLSTHVFGDWPLYERLGVKDQILAAGAPPLRRLRVDVEGCVLEADTVHTPFMLGLRRERLDEILVRRAAACPTVDWRPETTVTDLVWRDGAVAGVVLRGRDGAGPVTARATVGADGFHSFVARSVRAEEYLSGPEGRCGYYAYFADVVPQIVPTFEFYHRGPDIVLVNPCDDGLHCMVVFPPQDEFPAWKQDPARLLEERLGRLVNLAPRLRPARRVGPVRGSGTMRSYLRTPFGLGWALVGDAGAAIHPAGGAGIDNAVAAGEMLAEALHRYLAGEASWDDGMQAYHAGRDERVKPLYDYSMRMALRPPVPQEPVPWLRLLCTMPALPYLMLGKIEAVAALLIGEDGVDGFRPLVEATAARPREETAVR